MAERTVEDQLRQEYFELLPEIRRVLDELEAEVRSCLLPISRTLKKYDRLAIKSRVKDCESAIDALRRRSLRVGDLNIGQEGRIFDPSKLEPYTLKNLKDMAGIRVSVFPKGLIEKVSEEIRKRFPPPAWTSDPVTSKDKTRVLAEKYYGYCGASAVVCGEVQVVPMLTALFWEVEHAAFYKPSPGLLNLLGTETMQQQLMKC
jgi:ppGpp synthetase/RelA/SpoT-type nucleotidyltranferase